MMHRNQPAKHERPDSPESSIAACYAWHIADGALWAILIVVPLLMGGTHPLGRLLYVALVAVMTVAWLTHCALTQDRVWRLSGAEPVIALGFVVLLLQLTPLAPGWIAALSPGLADLLPQWSSAPEGGLGLGAWSTLSLTPFATREALVLYTAHALFFLVVLQRLTSLLEVQKILRRVAIVGVGMAGLGLAQYLSSNGKFLWIYQHPSRETHSHVVGAFSNPNHFSHFLALAAGPLLWCLIENLAIRQRRRESENHFRARRSREFDRSKIMQGWQHWDLFAISLGLGIAVLAVLLSMSRGGIMALALAMSICLALLATRSLVSRRTLISLLLTGSVASAAVFLHGYQELRIEIESLTAGSIDQLDSGRGRRKIWAADAQVAQQLPFFGAGAGSHRDIYPTFFSDPEDVEYVYAESGFLNLLVETGAAGMFVMALGILLGGYWAFYALWRPASTPHAACAAAVVGGLLASLAHSIIDFVWYIPACMILTLLLLACLCRLYQSGRRTAFKPGQWRLPRLGWAFAALTMLPLGGMMTWHLAPKALQSKHWDTYLTISLATNRFDRRAFEGSRRATLGELDGSSDDVLGAMMTHLDKALQLNPRDGRSHMRMASLCLRRFELEQQRSANAMALTHIRDAALASKFPSRKALDEWLAAAIGDNRHYLDLAQYHATQAVQLRPLQGRSYIQLAELCFLQGNDATAKHRYIEQALAVRPHDGAVLFEAGSEAVMVGQFEIGVEYWRKAFKAGPEYQAIIIQNIAVRVPPDFFLATFQPDLQGYRLLYGHYRRNHLEEALKYVGPLFAEKLEEQAAALRGRRAGALWYEAHMIEREIGLAEAATASGRQAVLLDGGDYEKRRTVAHWLYSQGHYAEAAIHLRWCLHRQPDDTGVQQLLRQAVISSNGRAATRVSQATAGSTETSAHNGNSTGNN